jgi:SAM-dependent methyltransferase
MNERKQIFSKIYENQVWNNRIPEVPLSGPGSHPAHCKEIIRMLDTFIYENNLMSILDLGCGDLSWIKLTNFFNDDRIKYSGIDIVESVILDNKKKFPEKEFILGDIVTLELDNTFDLIILRDVIFHQTLEETKETFNKIKNKFKYICITSSNVKENNNRMDYYYYSMKSIHIEPYNINKNYLMCIDEPIFNRGVYIYSHDDFFAC